MKRFTVVASLVLAISAIPVFSDRVAAGDLVPFKGNLAGTFTITPVPNAPPTLVDLVVTASGNGSHLGRFELSIPHRVDRSTAPPTAFGTYEFTAANGDTVTADFIGLSQPTATPGIIEVVEIAVITGGTGRFAGATGGFVSGRLVNQITRETTGTFKGSISRPGSGRP